MAVIVHGSGDKPQDLFRRQLENHNELMAELDAKYIQVCDLVMYGFAGEKPTSWRVSGHMKRVDEAKTNPYPKGSIDADMWNYGRKFVRETIRKERKRRKASGLPHKKRYRLLWCKPEEATHLCLSAVCGAIAPIQKCVKFGTVSWSKEQIEQDRKSALIHIQMNDSHPHHDWE